MGPTSENQAQAHQRRTARQHSYLSVAFAVGLQVLQNGAYPVGRRQARQHPSPASTPGVTVRSCPPTDNPITLPSRAGLFSTQIHREHESGVSEVGEWRKFSDICLGTEGRIKDGDTRDNVGAAASSQGKDSG